MRGRMNVYYMLEQNNQDHNTKQCHLKHSTHGEWSALVVVFFFCLSRLFYSTASCRLLSLQCPHHRLHGNLSTPLACRTLHARVCVLSCVWTCSSHSKEAHSAGERGYSKQPQSMV